MKDISANAEQPNNVLYYMQFLDANMNEGLLVEQDKT